MKFCVFEFGIVFMVGLALFSLGWFCIVKFGMVWFSLAKLSNSKLSFIILDGPFFLIVTLTTTHHQHISLTIFIFRESVSPLAHSCTFKNSSSLIIFKLQNFSRLGHYYSVFQLFSSRGNSELSLLCIG